MNNEPSRQADSYHPNFCNESLTVAERKGIFMGSFEFRNTKNGTRVLTKEMADFSDLKASFLSKKFSFYAFFPQSQNPVNSVIRHLSTNTPAEEITKRWWNLALT
jgi:hypothetical protein